MAIISHSAAATLGDNLAVFYTSDPQLSNSPILAFYGASTTSIANPANNSRIQCHIFTAAGLRSYPRLAVSPASTLYQAVNCLSREEQGDEVCRGLAFSLLKYFTELPEPAKSVWIEDALSTDRPSSALKLFSASHAANLASNMQQLANGTSVIKDVKCALATRSLSYLDADLILPAGSIQVSGEDSGVGTTLQDDDLGFRYGQYASLVKLFGEPLFIPTSKMRRAPSKTTTIKHNTGSTREQQSKLWREMCELAGTEENYVQKLDEMVNIIGQEFRDAVRNGGGESSLCEDIFPPNLGKILAGNASFLCKIQDMLQQASHEASRQDSETQRGQFTGDVDALNITSFAQCLQASLAQFKDSYQVYIQAHPHLSRKVKDLACAPESTLGKCIIDFGERKLLSMLIEPVQRLPRYSLYIDNMIKYLPATHPAVRILLSTKDAVAAICSPDSTSLDRTRLSRLETTIRSWPTSLPSSSRLVTAVDATELLPPYSDTSRNSLGCSSILLIFTEFIVVVRRHAEASMTSRTLMAGLDSASLAIVQSDDAGLSVSAWWMLSTITINESGELGCIQILPSAIDLSSTTKMQTTRSSATPPQTRVFRLTSAYEGQADRLTAEVAKARIENRYSEAAREDPRWEARFFEATDNNLGLATAISEAGSHTLLQQQSDSASLRILVNTNRTDPLARPATSRGELLVMVSSQGQGVYQLDVEAAHERPTQERVTSNELLSVLSKRVANLLLVKYQMRNPAVAMRLYQYHQNVLRSIRLTFDQVQPVSRSIRSHSPVKAITNLFGSSASSKDMVRGAVMSLRSPVLVDGPRFTPTTRPSLKTYSPVTTHNHHNREDSQVTLVDFDLRPKAKNPLFSLETTFATYVLAIRMRKDDVIAKAVARRALAPEAEVNELYNVLLDDSTNVEKAAQAAVGVLFAAFEKFLTGIWKTKMGSVIDGATLAKLEVASAMCSNSDREQHFAIAIRQLAPQNQRALRAVIDLLAELLTRMANDGDKGLLTAVFAEMLVEDCDPRDSIPLLEQLLRSGTLQEQDAAGRQKGLDSSSPVSARTTHTHSGSITSKAASFSKRLGFGSLRKELSKNDMFSSGSIRRKTVDDGRPAANTIFSDDNKDCPLSTQRTPQDQRKYDARNMDRTEDAYTLDPIAVSPFVTNINPFNSPLSPRKARPLSTTAIVPGVPLSPKTQSPKKSQRPQSLYSAATTERSPPKYDLDLSIRAPSVPSKSNTTPIDAFATIRGRPQQLDQANVDTVNTIDLSGPEKSNQKEAPSPGLRGVLCERSTSVNITAQPSSPVRYIADASGSPIKKLRIKSPQKMQHKAEVKPTGIEKSDNSSQDELASLTLLLTVLAQKQESSELASIASRLRTLQGALSENSTIKGPTHKVGEPTANTNAVALTIAERKISQLEKQLSQADSENTALYDRTNKELMGVFDQVRNGDGVNELRRRLAEEMEEAKKWREEAKRLKRENAALRSYLPDGDTRETGTEKLEGMLKPAPAVNNDYTAYSAKDAIQVKVKQEEEENVSYDDDDNDDHDLARAKSTLR